MITNAEQIIEAAEIYNIIADKIELKRSGAGFKGICPFHEEKSASFHVSPAKKIFTCFGCGKGGNAAKFLMEYDKISFPEALEKIAARELIEVQYDSSVDRSAYLKESAEAKTAKTQLIEVAAQAYELLKKNTALTLSKDKDYKLYGKRSYSRETIDKWSLVIAPKTNLLSTQKDIEISKLVSLGWIRPSKKKPGTYYDFFRGRILFPITNTQGQILGINGRINGEYSKEAKASTGPKYINSPESIIYNKSKILFGLSQNYKEINDKRFAYIVEGPTDVISLYEYGIRNAVGICGSAMTNDQARLIRRYTDTVIIVVDHDALHKTSTNTAIELLVANQIDTKVAELPEGHDPDSYIRHAGSDTWKEYIDENTFDAIEWRIKQMPIDSSHEKTAAMTLATSLVALIDNEASRRIFTKTLSKKIGISEAVFRDELISKTQNKKLKRNNISAEQELTVNKYNGIFESKFRYFYKGSENTIPLSNFVITPIMLVVARNHSIRLVKITNEVGHSEVMEISSDDFVGLNTLKKRVESRGSYVFWGREEQYVKIKRMIYDKTPTCYSITKMGLHSEGFFAWGNGITDATGKFTRVDRYGVVEHNGDKYYLPTFSEVDIDVKSDDGDNIEDPGKYHIYNDSVKAPSISEWATQFYKAFGDNGMVAVCHYIATVYRDFIMKKFGFFPILNLFGPIGSGKSFMSDRLICMFGLPRKAADVNNTTAVAIGRLAAQISNGYACYNEYDFKTDVRIDQILKSFYDGIGRPKGDKSNSNRTNTTAVFASILLAGQVLPSRDAALLERCVTLFFSPLKASDQNDQIRKQEGEKLLKWEDARLSQITAWLHSKRSAVMANFDEVYKDIVSILKENVGEDTSVRVLSNYGILLALYSVISKEIEMPFKLGKLMDFIVLRIDEQTNSVNSSNEIYTFWRLFSFMQAEKSIDVVPDEDYACKLQTQVRVTDHKDKPVVIDFETPKKVVYIKFAKIHGLYKEHGKKQGEERLFSLVSLKYYLSRHESFIGKVKAMKMSGKATRCYAFDLDKLPIDLELTHYDTASKSNQSAPTDSNQSEMQFNNPANGDPFAEEELVA